MLLHSTSTSSMFTDVVAYLGTTTGEDHGGSTGVFEPSLEGDSDSDTGHTGVCHTGGYEGVHT